MFKKICSVVKSGFGKVVTAASKVKALLVGAGAATAAVVVPEIASATPPAFTLAAPEIDMTLLGTLAATILGGLAAMWIVRKVIKTMNKS